MVSTTVYILCPFKGRVNFLGPNLERVLILWLQFGGGSHYFGPFIHNYSASPPVNNDQSLKHHWIFRVLFLLNQKSFLLNTCTLIWAEEMTLFSFFGLVLYFCTSQRKQFMRLFSYCPVWSTGVVHCVYSVVFFFSDHPSKCLYAICWKWFLTLVM